MSLDPVSSGDPHVAAHNEEREAINDLAHEMRENFKRLFEMLDRKVDK